MDLKDLKDRMSPEKWAILQAELAHAAQQKKDMPKKLAALREEFPNVTADEIVAKYKKLNDGHTG